MPSRDEHDGSIRWSWRAFSQSGELAMESRGSFETLTECLQDAKANGYDKS